MKNNQWLSYASKMTIEELKEIGLTDKQIDILSNRLSENRLLNPPAPTVEHHALFVCARCNRLFHASWITKRPIYCSDCK